MATIIGTHKRTKKIGSIELSNSESLTETFNNLKKMMEIPISHTFIFKNTSHCPFPSPKLMKNKNNSKINHASYSKL